MRNPRANRDASCCCIEHGVHAWRIALETADDLDDVFGCIVAERTGSPQICVAVNRSDQVQYQTSHAYPASLAASAEASGTSGAGSESHRGFLGARLNALPPRPP